ncbi:GTP-binding protein [Paraburkholderia sp. D15]|uniref:CobW family GTP-binding protein n=1 Tax=Paraburkholderia sp. D15 TaxID=2880218 RepID=UPI002479CB6E|nr:CobW family GTP-binding protein [Paraburkholderia sp. D15]WGS51790.1 GTP-binding protein [Paraburkholderia sp. D15]
MRTISLVVIGGYLGAGKTTLLNHVLTHAGSRRVTVLVNDFGSINIDAALIRERTDDVISLENGCVCCSIGGRLTEALLALSARDDPPDLLIIEASGVSDPLRIAQIGMLDRAFRLDGIVVLVDAERVEATLADPYVGDIAQRQIASATALVLNKMDLLDDAARRAALERVEALAHSRVMMQTSHGVVPPGLIFDLAECGGHDELAEHNEPRVEPVHHSRRHDPRPLGAALTPAALRSFSFVTDAVLNRRKLKDALLGFSARLLRAKGFVRLDDDGALHELHVAGSRVRITASANAGSSESLIVLIGLFDNDDEARARAALSAAQLGERETNIV